MPTCIHTLFARFEITNYQVVKPGTRIQHKRDENPEGIYIVTHPFCSFQEPPLPSQPNINNAAIIEWIRRVPNFEVDGTPATLDKVAERLKEFWLPDEVILYIGLAKLRKGNTGISTRVSEYYRTKLGSGGPHSGGQWLKCLSNISELVVYYATCANPRKMEDDMLKFFIQNVSLNTLKNLRDGELPLPFANLKLNKGRKKRDGFTNQRLK